MRSYVTTSELLALRCYVTTKIVIVLHKIISIVSKIDRSNVRDDDVENEPTNPLEMTDAKPAKTMDLTDWSATASDGQDQGPRAKKFKSKPPAVLTRSQSSKDAQITLDEAFDSTILPRSQGSSDLRDSKRKDAVSKPIHLQNIGPPPLLSQIDSRTPPETPVMTSQTHLQVAQPTVGTSRGTTRSFVIDQNADTLLNHDDSDLNGSTPQGFMLNRPHDDLNMALANALQNSFLAFQQEVSKSLGEMTLTIREAFTPKTSSQPRPSSRTPAPTDEEKSTSKPSRIKRKRRVRQVPPEDAEDLEQSTDAESDDLQLARPTSRLSNISQGRLQTRSNEKGITMPKFDGTDWVAFQVKFTTFCERYQLDDAEKLQRLTLALEHDACKVLHNGRSDTQTFQGLMRALESRYEHSKSFPMVEKELRLIRRQPGQTLQSLADQILEVTRKTPMPDDKRGQIARNAFVAALDDNLPLIHYIDKKDPRREDLAVALEHALKYERTHGISIPMTRLDALSVPDSQPVSSYQGKSQLMLQIEQNSKSLEMMNNMMSQFAPTLQQLHQQMNKAPIIPYQPPQQNRPRFPSPQHQDQLPDRGYSWPNSNYRGRNFDPNFRSNYWRDNNQSNRQYTGSSQGQLQPYQSNATPDYSRDDNQQQSQATQNGTSQNQSQNQSQMTSQSSQDTRPTPITSTDSSPSPSSS